MKTLIILLMISVVFLEGCEKEKKEVKKVAPELTASDISTALQMKWWQLKVPAGVENQHLGIGIKDGCETIKTFGGMSGLREGMCKVIVWGLDKDHLSYAIIGDNVSATGSVPNIELPDKEKGVVSALVPNGRIIIPDETFLLKGAEHSTLSDPVGAGQVGFCFTFAKPEDKAKEEEEEETTQEVVPNPKPEMTATPEVTPETKPETTPQAPPEPELQKKAPESIQAE